MTEYETTRNHKVWKAREKVIALTEEVDDENIVVQEELQNILHRLCLVGQAIDNKPDENAMRGNPKLNRWDSRLQQIECGNCSERFDQENGVICPNCGYDPRDNE